MLVPTYDWTTWVAAMLLGILALGIVWTLARYVIAMLARFVRTLWTVTEATLARWLHVSSTAMGSAHWAESWEMKKANLFNQTGLPLGTALNGKTIREPRGSHILLCAPPRAGKSWGIVMPVLRQFKGSVIVTDLRGELYRETRQTRETFSQVLKFDPTGDTSCSMNILSAIRWGTPFEFSDTDRIVHHLLSPQGDLGDSFRSNAIPIFRSIIAHCHDMGDCDFPSIVDWMTSADMTMNEKLEDMLTSPNTMVTRGARRAMDMSAKLRQGCWSSILEPLAIFEDTTIREHTRSSDIELSELLHGPDPISIFLCLPFHEVGRLARFLALFVEMIIGLVSTPGEVPRHKLLLCLDEMANLGKLIQLERAVSYLQGSGCQLLGVIQNMSQIANVYGNTSPLLSSISNAVYYAPVSTDLRTAKHVSDSLGTTTVPVRSVSESVSSTIGQFDRSSESVSYREQSRALLTSDEVTRLPKTSAIIFCQETPPVLAQKLGVPPPSKVRRTFAWGRAHPEMAVTALTVLACAALLEPLLQRPVIVSQAQPALFAGIPTTPTPAPASTPTPDASVPPATTNDSASLWDKAKAGTTPVNVGAGLPATPSWQLEIYDSMLFFNAQPTVLPMASRDTCQSSMYQRYRSQLTELKRGLERKTHYGKIEIDEPGHMKYEVAPGPHSPPRKMDIRCVQG
jgi:type IV secretory pathway TraG/TraD family ATPase VirD4